MRILCDIIFSFLYLYNLDLFYILFHYKLSKQQNDNFIYFILLFYFFISSYSISRITKYPNIIITRSILTLFYIIRDKLRKHIKEKKTHMHNYIIN